MQDFNYLTTPDLDLYSRSLHTNVEARTLRHVGATVRERVVLINGHNYRQEDNRRLLSEKEQ